jgi:kumamolisin
MFSPALARASKDPDRPASGKKEGFEITERSADHSSIYATAPWTQVEKSLQVNTVRVTTDGLSHTAARNAPSLPAEVGNAVVSIGGLQPFLQAHKHARARYPRNDNRVNQDHLVDATVHPGPNIENAPPYLVSEIRKAYGASGVGASGYVGKGQVIAILIDTFPNDSDLVSFWKRNGISPAPTIQKINVKGGHLPAPSGEETLDAQWSSGITPGATIRIYASGSLQFVDLDRALDRILADAAKSRA